ncbi:MAG: hypothetical protein IPJ52_06540 [Rhodocyclaceae bacterium]|nr:hypothetical protein [Rhodocyclaceae bacterium]
MEPGKFRFMEEPQSHWGGVMLIKRVDVDAAQLGDPDAAVWSAAKAAAVSLVQAPAAMQPTSTLPPNGKTSPMAK